MAAEGGLMAGDRILEMNGQKVESTLDFSRILEEDLSVTEFEVLVQRNGEKIRLEKVVMIPQQFPENEEGAAGTFYGVNWATGHLSFGEAIEAAWADCVYFVKLVWLSLGMLLSGNVGLGDMSGPVGIVQQMGQIAGASASWTAAVQNLLYFGAFIAVNLGVMNLLPIPALDGGRVVSLLLTTATEKITKKKLNPKYEGYIHAAGMVLLLGLMAVIMLKDIIFIFR